MSLGDIVIFWQLFTLYSHFHGNIFLVVVVEAMYLKIVYDMQYIWW